MTVPQIIGFIHRFSTTTILSSATRRSFLSRSSTTSSSSRSVQLSNTQLQQQQRRKLTMRYGVIAVVISAIFLFYSLRSSTASSILTTRRRSILSNTDVVSNTNSESSSTPYVSAFCAVPNDVTVANKIIDALITEKLVACVNTIPGVMSSYWWKGKVERDAEILLMMKTHKDLVKKVNEKIKDLHPYDVHELIVQPIVDGNLEYLNWIGESVQQQQQQPTK